MQVFKAYFKIIKKNIPMLSIYMVIFLSVVIGITTSSRTREMASFSQTRSNVAIVNEDKGAALSDGLVGFIDKNATIIDPGKGEEALRDALFYQRIDYILRIPEGFAMAFMNGEKSRLEETTGIDQTAGMYMSMMINNFLNTAKLYAQNMEDLAQGEVVEKTVQDLSKETPVIMKSYDSKLSNGEIMSFFFNYASYSTTIILIFGIVTFMLVFNKSIIKQRTLCSPLSQSQVVFQTLLANICFAVVIWAITMICGFVLYGADLFSFNGTLWGLNLLIFAMVSLAISFLIGSLIKNRNSLSPIANTIALGFSFLCGAFVPQALLGEGVLTVAGFLPTYWYIRASNLIGGLKTVNSETLGPILIAFMIQIGFFAAIIAVSMVINKQRRVESLA